MSEILETCAPYEADLSALVDGELAPEREAEVRAHLGGCAACSERLEALCDVDLALASIAVPPVPAGLRARLAERIARDAATPEGRDASRPAPERSQAPRRPAAATRGRPRRRLSRPALGAALAAAAALALYLAVTSVDSSLPLETPAPEPRVAESVPQRAAATAELAEAAPARPPEAKPPEVVPEADVLASASEEELGVILELETIEDLDVIAELDFLERWVALEEGASG
jgi:anti-sigma factor RsiW